MTMTCQCQNNPAATIINDVPTCARCNLPLDLDGEELADLLGYDLHPEAA